MSDRLGEFRDWQDAINEFKEIVWKRVIEIEEQIKEIHNELRNRR